MLVQAGLTKDHPTVNFMEDYAEVVLQKNIESLYACGGVVLHLSLYVSHLSLYVHTSHLKFGT